MRTFPLATAMLAMCWAQAACDRARADDDPDVLPVIKFNVTARGEPMPALRYRFLPTFRELKPGNGALTYAKVSVPFEGPRGRGAAEMDQRFGNEWMETPVDELPREKVEQDLKAYEHIFAEVDRAARMQTCDWQLDIRSEKPWNVRLPEVQGMRQIARALVVKARLQIHDKKYADAIRTLQTGFAMSRHVAEGETLVNALIGIAIDGILLNEVETLMRAPDAPNLYWALTALPRPMIDMRKALNAEMHFVDFSLGGDIDDLRNADLTPDEWRKLVNKMDRLLIDMNGGLNSADQSRALSAMLGVRVYPAARQWLINSGMTAEAVDKLPVAQVIAIHKIESFNRLRDNMFKWMYLPAWQQQAGARRADQDIKRSSETFEGFPLGEVLPAMQMSTTAGVRLERRITSLAAVNALRMHAAAHGGKLPATLAEITVAPVLADPSTGQPFGYSVQGGTATLTSPPMPNLPASMAGLHYEITIVP